MKTKYNIPDPKSDLSKIQSSKKYLYGEIVNGLNEIKHHKPVFAFDFLSLNNSDFCFNSTLINGHKEYHRLLKALKFISTKSYDELSKDRNYHFHDVDFKDITIPYSNFLKCIVNDTSKIDQDKGPTVYQFKVFEEARIFGFVYNYVFYLIFLDRNHQAYKRE